MRYIAIDAEGTFAYQEVNDLGYVTRYCDADGNTLSDFPPIGIGSSVVNDDPPLLGWMKPVISELEATDTENA